MEKRNVVEEGRTPEFRKQAHVDHIDQAVMQFKRVVPAVKVAVPLNPKSKLEVSRG